MPYRRGRPLTEESVFFRAATMMTFYFIWPIAQLINLVMFSTAYKNRYKLKGFRRAVLVSNHTTFLDPVKISGAMLPRRSWQTLLEKTVEAPFLGTFTRLLGGVPLPPGRSGLQKILDSSDRLFRSRRFIHFYPEGECFLYNQEIKEFKPGAFFIAAELDIPVIPMVTVFSQGRFKPYSLLGRNLPKEKLVVMDPVYPAEYIRKNEKGEIEMDSVREFAEAVRAVMQKEINARSGSSVFYRGRLERIKGING
ncbi:MAG: 1-acyl-sn-glycerol-3-phosphate acyltransferase [Treponema sp.]|nr:1-acyl-sn-glycerol-3-phosphate acyltransferase [Treponema sp.]